MTSMRPILVHVASGKWEALQSDASKLGITASQLVRNAIDFYFVSGRIFDYPPMFSGMIARVELGSGIIQPKGVR